MINSEHGTEKYHNLAILIIGYYKENREKNYKEWKCGLKTKVCPLTPSHDTS